jgi:hypothetical protein
MNVFSYTGIVLMVVGGGLGVGGFFMGPIGRLTLWSMGAGIFFTGVIFFFSGKRVGQFSMGTPGFMRSGAGLPGQATVLGMQETGVTMTGFGAGPEAAMLGFELLVQLPGRDPYQVSIKQQVPRMLLGAVLPGSVVSVAADPNDLSKVRIDFTTAPRPAAMGGVGGVIPGVAGGMPGAAPGYVAPMAQPGMAQPGMPQPGMPQPEMPQPGMAQPGMAQPGMAQPGMARPGMAQPQTVITGTGSAADLLATGQRGTASVTMYQPLGTPRSLGVTPSNPAYLDDPVYMFVLTVQLPGQQPFQAQMGHRVPPQLESTLRQGMTLNVAIDPANPTQSVAIDWGTP